MLVPPQARSSSASFPERNHAPTGLDEENPLLRLCGREQARIERIVVPLDGTARGVDLLRFASSVAESFGARLVLLHFYDAPTYAPAHMRPESLDAHRKAAEQEALSRLRLIRDELADRPNVRAAELVVTAGCIEDAMADTARQAGADLIVVSTHGYCGLKSLFLPSRAVNVVRHAPCPVLVCPQP